MYLVLYDIPDKKRLRKFARAMKRFGRRVQKSVYECHIDNKCYQEMWEELKKISKKNDKVRSYYIHEGIKADEI